MLKTSQKNLTILIFAVVSLLAAQPAYKLDTQGGRVPSKMANGFALKPNAENNNLFDQLFDDEIVETGYSYRNSYSRDNRSVDDTLYYDLPWNAYFYMSPGDVMVTAYQMDTTGIISGVNVPVYRWDTNSDGEELELTVSIHKLSYPYGSNGTMYDSALVNGQGWLGGYDDDGDGLMELEGTIWNSVDGVCSGGTMIGNAQDPLGTEAALVGPPGTPLMGLIWPDGPTAATLNPTDNPSYQNGGGDNWIYTSYYGTEPVVSAGDWIGVVVRFSAPDSCVYDSTLENYNCEVGFFYTDGGNVNNPWKSFKFYSSECVGTGGESGWYIRSYVFNYQLLQYYEPILILDTIENQEINEDEELQMILTVQSNIHSPMTFNAYADTSDVSLTLNNDTLTATPSPDWNGDALITVIVTDENGLSDTTYFTLTVNPVNDSPEEFSVIYPTVSDTFSTHLDSDTAIAFTWEKSYDVDSDEIYTLKIELEFFGQPYVDIHENISDTTINVSSNSLDALLGGLTLSESTLSWYVTANDEEYTVVSDTGEFVLSRAALGIVDELLPAVFTLHQNHPNPFNPVTTLRYDLPENSLVNIIIYDLLGRQVKSLINQTQDAGFKSVIWDATNDFGKPVSAGVYLYQIQAGEFVQTKKMVLLK